MSCWPLYFNGVTYAKVKFNRSIRRFRQRHTSPDYSSANTFSNTAKCLLEMNQVEILQEVLATKAIQLKSAHGTGRLLQERK